MSMRNRVARSIQESSFIRVAVGLCLSYVILSAVVFFAGNLIVSATPRTFYYNYENIEFVGKRGNYLLFASTRTVNQGYPMHFNDILRCGDSEFVFFSHQDANVDRPVVHHNVKKVLWNYNEPFPANTPCSLESHITMQVGAVKKQQTVISDTFVVQGE